MDGAEDNGETHRQPGISEDAEEPRPCFSHGGTEGNQERHEEYEHRERGESPAHLRGFSLPLRFTEYHSHDRTSGKGVEPTEREDIGGWVISRREHERPDHWRQNHQSTSPPQQSTCIAHANQYRPYKVKLLLDCQAPQDHHG